jgi:probable HAF family extracellular repeat protein
LALLLFAVVAAESSATPAYSLVDLGTNGVTYTDGRAVNESGQCVGFIGDGGADRAYRTSGLRLIQSATDDLGTLGGTYAQAYGVNSLGQAVGLAGVAGDFAYRAFRTAPNQPINPATDNLGLLSTGGLFNLSLAYDINDSGQVTGVSDVGGFQGWPAHAFRTAPNQPINPLTDDLGTLGGNYSEGRAINELGQVTGFAFLSGDAGQHAFRTAPNAAINLATDDLGTLGGSDSVGRDINDFGIVVGEAQLPDGQWRAFRTAPNAAINPATDNLGTLGGTSSRATGVNNEGTVVGFSTTASGERHAFVYTDAGGLQDLNDLVDPATAAGWVLVEARNVNEDGAIIGTGTLASQSRAFVLVPGLRCDVNGDGGVDLLDLEVLVNCVGGPGVGVSDPCLPADLQLDGDVDLGDFGEFQLCFEAP